MRRVIIESYGGPEQLKLESFADQQIAGAGEVLVDVEAAGVNYIDVYQRKGEFKVALPYTPGFEGVGRVREVGDEAKERGIEIGSRVAWINTPGSYASQIVIPAAQAIPIPLSFTAAEGLLFQAITAHYLATEYRNVGPGDRVLVHAAAGGVGQLLVQLLKHSGAWVVGTTSSDTKAAAARAAGADAVINYGRDYTFLDELLSLTDGKGVNLAFDSVGATTLVSTVKGLAIGGTAVSCGSASGPAPAIDPMLLIPKAARLAGGSLFAYIADPSELQRRATTVVEALRGGWLRMGTGTAYKLDHVADAHRAVEGRGTPGKIYLEA